MDDFRDEISGYNNNSQIVKSLNELQLNEGTENIPENMILCYKKLIDLEFVGQGELSLLMAWLKDMDKLRNL